MSSCHSVTKVNTPVYFGKSVNSRKVATFKKGTSAPANCGGETGGSHTACGVTNKYWLWFPEYAGRICDVGLRHAAGRRLIGAAVK